MVEGIRDPVSIAIEGLIRDTIKPPSKPKIFKVDDRLRQVKAEDYEPKIIAIGPIHGGKDHLKMMEQNKLRYLNQLLQRCKRTGLTIDKFVERMREIEQNARRCYPTLLDRDQAKGVAAGSPDLIDVDEKYKDIDKESFVKMMLLDGCFIIELVRKYFANDTTDEKDPVFESETLSQIRHDLMLFENQLPFFVLNQLFEMTRTNDPDENLCQLVKFLVDDMFPWPDVLKFRLTPDEVAGIDHLLGLTYRCFSPFSSKSRSSTRVRRAKSNGGNQINSASELKEAGILLKRSDGNSLTFEKGVLKLPPLQVSGKAESVLRNLMAYEQLRPDDCHRPKHVTDYVFFMHCLIRSTKDVEALRRSGVLGNYLGGDDRVYHMLDRLVINFLRSSEFCYSGVFERLNSHCGDRREKYMARLWRDYFNSPWSLLSFIAAAVLLGISIAQLVFTVLTYKHHKKRG